MSPGDAVVYDASVLHFGTANEVAGNERVVLYFSVAAAGAAAAAFAATLEAPPSGSVEPVPLSRYYPGLSERPVALE